MVTLLTAVACCGSGGVEATADRTCFSLICFQRHRYDEGSLLCGLPSSDESRCTMSNRIVLRPLLATAIGFGPTALGQTDVFWTNPNGGNWFAGTNWSDGQVPNNAGGQTFNAHIDLVPALAYTVVLDNSATINNLDLN